MRGVCVFRIKIGEDAGVFRSKKKILNKIMVQNGKMIKLISLDIAYWRVSISPQGPFLVSALLRHFFVYNFICVIKLTRTQTEL